MSEIDYPTISSAAGYKLESIEKNIHRIRGIVKIDIGSCWSTADYSSEKFSVFCDLVGEYADILKNDSEISEHLKALDQAVFEEETCKEYINPVFSDSRILAKRVLRDVSRIMSYIEQKEISLSSAIEEVPIIKNVINNMTLYFLYKGSRSIFKQ